MRETDLGEANRLFALSTLGRLKEKHLLLDNRVVLHHAERAMQTGPDHRAIITSHGHGDQADGDGSGLGCREVSIGRGSVVVGALPLLRADGKG